MVVEISYRGLRVARGQLEADGDPGFLPFEAPLPVGTRVLVHVDGQDPREAIVAQVVEQDSTAKSPAGMKLRWAAAPPVADSVPPTASAVPEPADSSTRTVMMPAVVVPDEAIEPADSPRTTLLNMPAIRDADLPAEPEPEPEAGGKKRKRKR